MAETWLEEIYCEAKIITQLKEAIRLLHVGDDIRACDIWNLLIPEIKRICSRYDQMVSGAGEKLLRITQRVVQSGGDYIAFADSMEELLLPELERYMSAAGHIRVEDEGFEIESSSVGYLALRDIKNDYLIHGLSDPMEDARVMAEYIYCPEYDEYCILGSAFGYLAYQIYLISGGSAKIRIYETDKKLQFYGRHYGVLDWIPKTNLYIEKDTDILKFLHYVDQHNIKCVVSQWILPFIPRKERDAILDVLISYTAERNIVDNNFEINFYKNLEADTKLAAEIEKEKLGEDFIVVAAGPSLDQTMDFLTQHQHDMTVIAVGTVFRKLLNRGIVPDFVTILESHELVYEQLKGLEDQKVPMLIPMCAYWKIAERYQGDVYMFPSRDHQRSVEFAKEHQLEVWEVGGTVSYQAVEAAVILGAKSVYLLGLDLAYPDALSHAEDTPQRKTMEGDDFVMVEKVGGGQVASDRIFVLYREVLEEYIQAYGEVKFYNLSRVGSRIKGTIELDPDNV